MTVSLTVGFPVVFAGSDEHNEARVVHAWIEVKEGRSEAVGMVKVLVNGELLPEIPVERVPSSDPFLNRLVGRRQVTLSFLGKVDASELFRFSSTGIPVLAIDGPSSGLAYFLANELAVRFDEGILQRPTTETRLLVSGKCVEVNGKPEIKPLGSPGDLNLKAAEARGIPLWLHRLDYDLVPQELRATVKPFLAPLRSPEWLVQEVADGYCPRLTTAKRPEPTAGATERGLFKAAINDLYFPDRDERLEQYFNEYSNRALLALQEQALLPANKGLFAEEVGDAVRHAFISGPTGCGKTTLMHSLVLNVIHNREGAALFVGPVKALVEEFHWSLVGGGLSRLLSNRSRQRCFISTSDYTDNDHLIAKGDFAFASMVYEKASILFDGPTGDAFTDSLDLVILDEVHMLRDSTRGDVVDMLIAKVARKNAIRAETGQRPIQIVLISTEDIATELAPLEMFRVSNYSKVDPEPVRLTVTARRPSFDHFLIRRTGKKFKSAWICDFDDQSQRSAEPEQIKTTLGRISTALDVTPTSALGDAMVRSGAASLLPEESDEYKTRSLKFVYDLIERRDHRSVIVVCSAISLCEALAGGMQNFLSHPVQEQSPDEAFLAAVKETEFEKKRRERLTARARRGIFTHHSQMPARLRAAVADAFRKPIRANSRPKVLFTTETLAYGVNLSASALVLTDLEFLRTDPVNPDKLPKRKTLTPNQYHNLLGRAGRMGFDGQGPKSAAFIWAPDKWFAVDGSTNRSTVHKFLRTYYGKQMEERHIPLSTIAHSADFERMSEPAPQLKRFSYSIFRTILECVRSAGAKGTHEKEVLATFHCSIGYLTANQQLRLQLDQLFEKVYRLIADYKSGALTLLLHRGDSYSIQPTAEALLNTGISLHAVEPISDWLEILRRSGVDSSSPIALIPALVATPEFTQAANELLYLERLRPLFGTQGEVEKNTERTRSQARLRWSACGLPDALFDEVERYLETEPAMKALGIFDQSMRQACFYLLLTGVLAWLAGAPFSEMEAGFTSLFSRRVENARSWQPKYSDRLEMLVRMTYNFFSQGEGYLSEGMRLALPRFAYQVRYGIPSRAMPYQNVFRPAEVSLPRGVILALDGSIGDPFSILHGPETLDVPAILEAAGIDPGEISRERVRQVILDSYRYSLGVFLGRLKDERSSRFVDEASGSLRMEEGGEVDFALTWRPERLLAAATQLHHVGNYVTTDHESGRLRLLGWHDRLAPQEVGITPCAFILIVALQARQALPVDVFATVLTFNARRISVEWFAKEVWDRFVDLAPQSRLRESLLAFIEPCCESI